ncbi:MAG: GWxTD domain-containing protein [Acidobacteriota bacterium]
MPAEPRHPEPAPRREHHRDGRLISPSALAIARLLRLRPPHGPKVSGGRIRDPLEAPRWALSLAFILVLLLFLSLLVVFFLPAEAQARSPDGINFDDPTKDWYKGPVRYIITKQEIKAYKALDAELDRINFINWFWERRDIVPETPENEFRDRFEQRVFEATRLFAYTAKPGWKTDMGKIYILVGPPDEVNADMMGKTHRGIVTWVYRSPPFPDLPPNTVIGFARDPSGEFVLSTRPTYDADVARWLPYQHVKLTADNRLWSPGRDPALLDQGAPIASTELETMMIYGKVQQIPPEEEELFRDIVLSREFYGSIPMDSRVDFYKAADDTTYTTLTVGIKSSSVQFRSTRKGEMPDLYVFGKLIDKENPEQEYPLGGDGGFTASLTNEKAGLTDLLIFQATGAFPPGKYELVLGVEDRVSKNVSAYRKEVEIADLAGDRFSLSSLTLAARMEPLDSAERSGQPFHLGRFEIVPQPDNTFKGSDELNIYFQVYNPARDPETGRPRLDVLYHFRSRDGQGNYQDVGTYQVQDSPAQVQGYAVPLGKWPKGQYHVKVTVLDRVSGETASREGLFFIRP